MRDKSCPKCGIQMKKRVWHPFGKKSRGRRMLFCKCKSVDYLLEKGR